MNRLTGIAALLLAAMAFAGPALARQHRGPEMFEMWREELELSDEQLIRIKELHFDTRVTEIEKRAIVELAELELTREMDQDAPDETKAMRLFDDVHEARGELEKVHLKNRLRMKGILTKEQQVTLGRLLREKREERRMPPQRHRRPR